jgi:rare lipoprotein A
MGLATQAWQGRNGIDRNGDPLPSYARVRNLANGREVVVRVNDRGPFHPGRVIDLSYAAAMKLDVRGVSQVELQRITGDEIRRVVDTAPTQTQPSRAQAQEAAQRLQATLRLTSVVLTRPPTR